MRLFLGFVPGGAARELYGLCDRLEFPDGLPLRWVPPENWHITAVFLGDVPERALGKLSDAVAPLVESATPLRARLEGLRWFPSPMKPRLLALNVDASPDLYTLQASLAGALRREGFHSERREYRPHLTLARLKGPRKLIDPPPLPPIMPIDIELDELVLFESHRGERPYQPLQSFGMAA